MRKFTVKQMGKVYRQGAAMGRIGVTGIVQGLSITYVEQQWNNARLRGESIIIIDEATGEDVTLGKAIEIARQEETT